MRTAIYTCSATGNEISLKAQYDRCAKYAAEYKHVIVEMYEDAVQSGRTGVGSAMQRLMSNAEEHRFEAVIVEDSSRLSRSMKQLQRFVDSLKNLGIQLIAVGNPDNHNYIGKQ
jgi:DNA invertase Pin-like site-specific DNA recombinase